MNKALVKNSTLSKMATVMPHTGAELRIFVLAPEREQNIGPLSLANTHCTDIQRGLVSATNIQQGDFRVVPAIILLQVMGKNGWC